MNTVKKAAPSQLNESNKKNRPFFKKDVNFNKFKEERKVGFFSLCPL